MDGKIIRLSELTAYHHIKEVYKDSLACFRLDNRLVNIDTIPPVFADMFSFLMTVSGTATFTVNGTSLTTGRGDLLLLSPSTLVAITGQSRDFEAMNLLCERSLFEHMMSESDAYQSYSLFFCRTGLPVLHLTQMQADCITATMRQISATIFTQQAYRQQILSHQLHTLMLQALGPVEERMTALPPALNHDETLFHNFINLLVRHYREEHYIGFYARGLCISSTYLSRVVCKVTQKTAGYFITGLLYGEACRLLARTDKTIQTIAAELHFSDQSAFGKFFKTNSGISPQQYRMEQQSRPSSV